MKKRLIKHIEKILDEGFAKQIPLTAEFLAESLIDRVIVLPCRIGDPVFKVVPECDGEFEVCPFYGGRGTFRCKNKPCTEYIEERKFALHDYDEIGKTLFLTREEAEKRLNEIK